MVASKLKLIMFLIILSLQLSAILSKNGMSMTLHMRSNEGFVQADDQRSYKRFAKIVEASKNRALSLMGGMYNRHRMKLKTKSLEEMSVEEPLYYPSDLIEYYIKLSVGTPAQDLLLVLDTGSSLAWAPCTTNYTCDNCSGYSTVFLPSKSSTAVPVQCADTKCTDLFGSIDNCSTEACPGYLILYGTGNATGFLLTDTFTLPFEDRAATREIKNFGVGCSVVSSVFSGIAGFGRGGLSVPSQLSPLLGDKFAYCLNNQDNSSKIVLGDMAVPNDNPLNYTPLLTSPYNDFYYIGLEAVSIDGKRFTLSSNFSTIDSNGNGGTIIDSGTSVTLFSDEIYEQIVGEFASKIGYRRAPDVEAASGFGLCYNVSGAGNISFPEFAFHFQSGSDMVLPDENCFTQVTSDSICLAMVNTHVLENAVGPAVLLGNYQQQNFYILYDRENNRLGFTKHTCKTLG